MIAKINHTISIIQGTNNPEGNTTNLESNIQGGSGVEFTTPESYDEGSAITNNFQIRNNVVKAYELYNGNTFQLDILTLIEGDKTKVTTINAFCVETSDSVKKIPVRFDVTITVGTDTVELGRMSNLSLNNIDISNIQALVVSGISIPTNKRATLFIFIGSSENLGTIPTT